MYRGPAVKLSEDFLTGGGEHTNPLVPGSAVILVSQSVIMCAHFGDQPGGGGTLTSL